MLWALCCLATHLFLFVVGKVCSADSKAANWVMDETLVANTTVQYEGFLGKGIWNIGVLSTPGSKRYREWIRCSTPLNEQFSVTFLVGMFPHDDDLLREMSIHKDVLLFNLTESYGFAAAQKVFGFFDAVIKHSPDSRFVVKSDHDVSIEKLEILFAETTELQQPIYYGRVWGGDVLPKIPVVRNKNSKHYVPYTDYEKEYFPPFCSGWGYALDTVTLKRISDMAISHKYFANEDSWLGILTNELGIKAYDGKIVFKGNVQFEDNNENETACPKVNKYVCGFTKERRFVMCHD